MPRRSTVLVGVLAVMLVAACEPAPPPGTSHSPSGYVDSATIVEITCCTGPPSLTVRVRGWASDWDTTAPIGVAFLLTYSNGSPAQWYRGIIRADTPRADVARAFSRGANYGFDRTIPVDDLSITHVCVSALNVGAGDNTFLGCARVRTADGRPWTYP